MKNYTEPLVTISLKEYNDLLLQKTANIDNLYNIFCIALINRLAHLPGAKEIFKDASNECGIEMTYKTGDYEKGFGIRLNVKDIILKKLI